MKSVLTVGTVALSKDTSEDNPGNGKEQPSNASQQQNVMTMFNIMNMLMGQNAGLQLPFASQPQTTSSGGNTPETDEELTAPKSATALVSMVKNFGEEKLTAVSPSVASRLPRLGELTDAQAETLATVECTQCSERLPSILALSSHYDAAHSSTLPDSAVQSFADRICEMIPDVTTPIQTNGHHLQYFDINNSPSESQIKEMSLKAGLPEKVIKHWFRNTLFKERQRDKDSPYNFSVPPQMGIDLDTYEKTGETKVVPLASAAEVKREPSPKPVETPTVPPLNLQAMMQQMQHANPFQFMDPSGMISGPITQLSQSSTSGRRANRTRFTDYQLRTLQQFFDKQAYPKDDDLEVLSKKLQLSPRVIVVWFQNARQKVSVSA
ncbi:unnamed protein product [Haemonchus placei]|uniref:Homeobox domain-containing protein n=1 Tax=Haemonchus placei TaxID=6290 RepID=A0A0N4XAH6_HAEPC|nr:unnamed protein product [Haemonchus placei]